MNAGIPVWKESQLATLFHGLETDAKGGTRSLATSTAMSQYAKGLRARMHDSKEGLMIITIEIPEKGQTGET